MNQNVYLHFGYPKCFSTALQRNFFEKHTQINFGGVGVEDNISYVNQDVEICFESHLKYSNDIFWERNKKRIKKSLEKLIKNSLPKKTVFSSEHLSFNFTLQGLNNGLKYQRINYLFDNFNIKILLFKRKPVQLIRSLYSEFLKMGYAQDYLTFLNWVIKYKERNFMFDLNFDIKHNQLKYYFKEENILWLDYNIAKEKGVKEYLNNELSNWLNIENRNLDIKQTNVSLTKNQQKELLDVNKKMKRGLSDVKTESFEKHRYRSSFKKCGLIYREEVVFSDVVLKRKALNKLIHKEYLSTQGSREIVQMEEKIINQINNC